MSLAKFKAWVEAHSDWEPDPDYRAETLKAFSFDVDGCWKRLQGDDFQKITQAHLFLDHILSRMIEEALPAPQHLNFDRMAFAQKLDLAAGLGLLDPDTKGRRINSLRNKLSHDLNYVVSVDDKKELKESSTGFVRILIEDAVKRSKRPSDGLYETLQVNICVLDVIRQSLIKKREEKKRRDEDLMKAIDRAVDVLRQNP